MLSIGETGRTETLSNGIVAACYPSERYVCGHSSSNQVLAVSVGIVSPVRRRNAAAD